MRYRRWMDVGALVIAGLSAVFALVSLVFAYFSNKRSKDAQERVLRVEALGEIARTGDQITADQAEVGDVHFRLLRMRRQLERRRNAAPALATHVDTSVDANEKLVEGIEKTLEAMRTQLSGLVAVTDDLLKGKIDSAKAFDEVTRSRVQLAEGRSDMTEVRRIVVEMELALDSADMTPSWSATQRSPDACTRSRETVPERRHRGAIPQRGIGA